MKVIRMLTIVALIVCLFLFLLNVQIDNDYVILASALGINILYLLIDYKDAIHKTKSIIKGNIILTKGMAYCVTIMVIFLYHMWHEKNIPFFSNAYVNLGILIFVFLAFNFGITAKKE